MCEHFLTERSLSVAICTEFLHNRSKIGIYIMKLYFFEFAFDFSTPKIVKDVFLLRSISVFENFDESSFWALLNSAKCPSHLEVPVQKCRMNMIETILESS